MANPKQQRRGDPKQIYTVIPNEKPCAECGNVASGYLVVGPFKGNPHAHWVESHMSKSAAEKLAGQINHALSVQEGERARTIKRRKKARADGI